MSAKLGLRALPLTFFVYCVEATLAVFASFPLAAELTPRLAAFADTPLFQAAALDPSALRELGALARGFLRANGLALLAMFVLAPWLQMSWLGALAEPQSPLRALARGARRLPRAWLVSIGVWLGGALAAAPFLALAFAMTRWLAGASAQHADLALLGSVLPLLPILLYVHVAHDLARAASLDRRAGSSVLAGLRGARRPSAWLPGLGALAVGLMLPAATHAASWPLRGLSATLLLQAVLFVRLVVRGAWLGHALTCVAASDGALAHNSSDRKYDD